MKSIDSLKSQKTDHDSTTETLGSRWKSADAIARRYDKSRPWVYAICDRFKIRNVSLGPPDRVGARLFDSQHLEEVIEALAEAQKGQPRINPRSKK